MSKNDQPTTSTPTTAEEPSASILGSSAGSDSPEMVIIRKDWLCFATSAMRLGRESMQAELFDHDRRLGRTIQRNKWAAETMEGDIEEMDLAIKRLNDFKFSHFQNKKNTTSE